MNVGKLGSPIATAPSRAAGALRIYPSDIYAGAMIIVITAIVASFALAL